MTLRSIFFGTMLAGAATLGCGDDSDGGDSDPDDGGGGQRTVPQQRCDAFMSHWCTHVFDCLVLRDVVSAAEGAEGLAQCTGSLENLCDDAIEVQPSYDACMEDITAMSCDTVVMGYEDDTLALPDRCMGVIVTAS